MIQIGQPLRMPPYRAVNSPAGGAGFSWAPEFGIAPFEAFNWTGVPISNHRRRLPILWHPGTWNSNYKEANPEADLSDSAIIHRQYGHGIDTGSHLTRWPMVSMIINGRFGPYVWDDPIHPTRLGGILDNFQTLLDKNNVFVAIILTTPQSNDPFAAIFPSAGEVPDAKPFSGIWKKRTYNSAQWRAGKILHLSNVQINLTTFGSGGGTLPTDGASSGCPFYQVRNFPNVGATFWDVEDDASVVYYSGQANTLAANVPLLKQSTYVTIQSYPQGSSVGQVNNYTATMDLMKSKVDAFPSFSWLTYRKYLFFNGFSNPHDPDTDLTSPLTDDVRAFLESL